MLAYRLTGSLLTKTKSPFAVDHPEAVALRLTPVPGQARRLGTFKVERKNNAWRMACLSRLYAYAKQYSDFAPIKEVEIERCFTWSKESRPRFHH